MRVATDQVPLEFGVQTQTTLCRIMDLAEGRALSD